jgi:hypothetical protein
MRLLFLLYQLKLYYITYLFRLLLIELFYFEAIKTIISIKHINPLISFSIYYMHYVFRYILILLYLFKEIISIILIISYKLI